MTSINSLISIADAYKRVAGVDRDQTVSYRVFGDSKKLTSLRAGAGITLDRFNASIEWFRDNWPKGCPLPPALKSYVHTAPHARSTPSNQDGVGK